MSLGPHKAVREPGRASPDGLLPCLPIGVVVRGGHARQGLFFPWLLSTSPSGADLEFRLLLTSAPICLWWEKRPPRERGLLNLSQEGPPSWAPLEPGLRDQKAMLPSGDLPLPQAPETMIKFSSPALDLPASSLNYSAHHPNNHSSSAQPISCTTVPHQCCFLPLSVISNHQKPINPPPSSSSPLPPAALPHPNPKVTI